MRKKTRFNLSGLALVVSSVALMCSPVFAQCSGRSRGGPPNSSPGATSPGMLNNMAYAQQQNLIAQQRYQYARAQQRNFQRQFAHQRQQQQCGESEATPTFGSEELQRAYAARPTPSHDRRTALRQKNAEKAYAYAVRSESDGKLAAAERQYRRVVSILGDTDGLGRLAAGAIEAITANRQTLSNVAQM